MKKFLILICSQPGLVEPIVLKAGEQLVFGRSQDVDVQIPIDGFMSGTHFSIDFNPQRAKLTDCESRNGTFLNGTQIAVASLSHGDHIFAGTTNFQVCFEEDPSVICPIKHHSLLKGIVCKIKRSVKRQRVEHSTHYARSPQPQKTSEPTKPIEGN